MMKKIFSRTLSALLAVMMVISSMVVMALPTAAAETNSTIDMGDNSVNDLYTPRPADVEAWDGTAATEFAGGTGTPEDPYLIATPGQYKLFADNIVNEHKAWWRIREDAYLAYRNTISDPETGKTNFEAALVAASVKSGKEAEYEQNTFRPAFYNTYTVEFFPVWATKSYQLTADIYLNDFFLTEAQGFGEGKMPNGSGVRGLNSTPLLTFADTTVSGRSTDARCTFSGVLDGAGHTIYNGYVNGLGYNTSMFGDVSGTIKNLGIKGAYHDFNAWLGSGAVMAVNLLSGGAIINCHVNAHTYGQRNNAILVLTKHAGSILEGCSVSGKNIQNTRTFAGLVQTLESGTADAPNVIKDCINYSDIKATDTTAGVVRVVKKHTRVINCINYGSITSVNTYAAGVTLEVSNAGDNVQFEGCINYGTITAKTRAGGVIGSANNQYNYLLELADCYNYGKISSSQYAGGIIGFVGHVPYMSNCANYGAVSATTTAAFAGGLVGYSQGDQWTNVGVIAVNCANFGTITSDNYAGGLVGRVVGGRSNTASHQRGLTLVNCVSAGVVTGTTGAGSAAGLLVLCGVHNGNPGRIKVELDNVFLNGALCSADSPAITHLTIGSNVYLDKTIAGFAGATDSTLFESAQQYSATAMVDGTYLPLLNAFVNNDLGDEVDVLWYQSTALGAPAPVTNLKVSNASVSVGTTPAIAVLLSGVSGLPSDAEIQLVNSAGRAVAATKVDGSRYRFDFAVELANIGLTDTYYIMVNGQKSVHSYELSVAGLLGKMYQSSSEAEQGLMVAMVNYSYYAGNASAFDVFNAVAGTAFAPSVEGAEAIADAGSVSINAGYEARLDISKGFVIIVTQNGDVVSEHVKSVLNATDIVNLGSAGSVSVAAMLNHYLGDPAHADLAKAAILFYEAAVAAQDEAALGQ